MIARVGAEASQIPMDSLLCRSVRRTLILLLALVAASCAYESSGTTTTTTTIPEEAVPELGPADIEISDQRVEGSFFVVDRVSMPAEGWVVARMDQGGAPGEVIGMSELLTIGVIERVAVPFSVPIAEDMVVHVAIHIDVDRDARFTYEPPDQFIDDLAVRANGEPATARAQITVLPPLTPADVEAVDQVSEEAMLTVASASLPSDGFVVVHADDDGLMGAVLGWSELLEAGDHTDIEVELSQLQGAGLLHVAVYIDRNEDGEFGPGEGADEVGVRDDGSLAVVTIEVLVPIRFPAALEIDDQESDGTTIIVSFVDLPFPGFIEILTEDEGDDDDDDAEPGPGTRLGVSELLAHGVSLDVEVTLSTEVDDDPTLWVRLWVDLDQDGELSADDAIALDEQGGDPIEFPFDVTVE